MEWVALRDRGERKIQGDVARKGERGTANLGDFAIWDQEGIVKFVWRVV